MGGTRRPCLTRRFRRDCGRVRQDWHKAGARNRDASSHHRHRRIQVRKGSFVFTSESVAEGHPDKVCDRISDTVVDMFLTADPMSRVGCETLATTNRIVIAGEVRGPKSVTKAKIAKAARQAV